MPLMAGDITNITWRESSELGPDNRLHGTFLYSFMVRGQGPIECQIPKDGFTAQKALAVIQHLASEFITVLDNL